MIPEKLIKEVTEVANKELRKKYPNLVLREWQTEYILEAYKEVRKK